MSSTETTKAQPPLEDVRVLDVTHHIAGPYCTKLLADYGAEVIKVERPSCGDAARRVGPFLHDSPHLERSGLFLHLNTNKKSVTLDLGTATGARLFKELATQADIVVENFRPGVMWRFGLSYEELSKVNPDLIMVSISNFGQSGPYRDFKATELVAYAMGSTMDSTGVPDREPLKLGLTVVQFQAGNMAAAATMGAFYGNRSCGAGQHVDVSIMECQLASVDRSGPSLVSVAYSGNPTFVRTFARRFSIMPFGVYPCADGYVHFTAAQKAWWPKFCKLIGMPELTDDPLYSTDETFNDLSKAPEIDAMFLPWVLQHTKQEVTTLAADLAGTPVNTTQDLFRDPHFKARGFFVPVEHPVAGNALYPGAPFRMTSTPWKAGRAPTLGEHNQEIYAGRLGLSEQDLTRLRQTGIV